MVIKKHLEGGTIRLVMVEEIKRVLSKYQDDTQKITRASLELGITPKTLRQWLGPIEKGGWAEFQSVAGAVEKVMATTKKPKKKEAKKPLKKTSKPKKAVGSTAMC